MKKGKKILLVHSHTDKGIWLSNELGKKGYNVVSHEIGPGYDVEGYLGPAEIPKLKNLIPDYDVAIMNSGITNEYPSKRKNPNGYKTLVRKLKKANPIKRIITLSEITDKDSDISDLSDKVYCGSIPSDEDITQLIAMIEN